MGTVTRRVEGETFLIQEAKPGPGMKEALQEKLEGVLQAQLQRSMEANSKGQAAPEEKRCRKQTILGDSLCFWHACLFANGMHEYLAQARQPSGGPKDRDRLVLEISRAKALHAEVCEEARKEGLSQVFVESLQQSATVLLQDVDAVARLIAVRLRVTLDPKAGWARGHR